MHLGDLKKGKGRNQGQEEGTVRDGIGKQGQRVLQEEELGKKKKNNGRAQDGPEPFRSGEKNQCNSRKDRHALSSGPSVSISSSHPSTVVPALKCGTRSWGTHNCTKKVLTRMRRSLHRFT